MNGAALGREGAVDTEKQAGGAPAAAAATAASSKAATATASPALPWGAVTAGRTDGVLAREDDDNVGLAALPAAGCSSRLHSEE